MKRLLLSLLLILLMAPLAQAAIEVTYPPDVMLLELKIGDNYSFTVNLANKGEQILKATPALDVENFIVGCSPPYVELGLGEKKSITLTLKPLSAGEFERIIDIMFEGDGVKVAVIGIKIRGVVKERKWELIELQGGAVKTPIKWNFVESWTGALETTEQGEEPADRGGFLRIPLIATILALVLLLIGMWRSK